MLAIKTHVHSLHVQGNDIGQDKRMTFEHVREEVCRVVSVVALVLILENIIRKITGAECM